MAVPRSLQATPPIGRTELSIGLLQFQMASLPWPTSTTIRIPRLSLSAKVAFISLITPGQSNGGLCRSQEVALGGLQQSPTWMETENQTLVSLGRTLTSSSMLMV